MAGNITAIMKGVSVLCLTVLKTLLIMHLEYLLPNDGMERDRLGKHSPYRATYATY
jgi:hypothetical protein